MLDALGNYLHCSPCICNAFGISSQRLARQRNVKRRIASQPVIEMKKSDVEEQLLGECVVMPDERYLGLVEVTRVTQLLTYAVLMRGMG